jgi:Cytochrome oxidase complex assembly protein 1
VQPAESDSVETQSSSTTVAVVLALLLAIALLFGGLFFAGINLIARSMKGSEAYRASLEYLRKTPQVVTDLGAPIEDGFMPSGRIAATGNGGSADLSIALEGPKGEGRAHVTLTRGPTGWSIASADWAHDGHVTTLVQAASSPGAK